MLIINFEGREAKGLSKGRYDETFAGEDVGSAVRSDAKFAMKRMFWKSFPSKTCH